MTKLVKSRRVTVNLTDSTWGRLQGVANATALTLSRVIDDATAHALANAERVWPHLATLRLYGALPPALDPALDPDTDPTARVHATLAAAASRVPQHVLAARAHKLDPDRAAVVALAWVLNHDDAAIRDAFLKHYRHAPRSAKP